MYLTYVICVFFFLDLVKQAFLLLSTGSRATKIKDCLEIPISAGIVVKKIILGANLLMQLLNVENANNVLVLIARS